MVNRLWVMMVGRGLVLGFLSPMAVMASDSVADPATQTASTTAPATMNGDDEGWRNNNLIRTPNDIHALLIDETADVFRRGDTGEVTVCSEPAGILIRKERRRKKGLRVWQATYTSRTIRWDFPFNDVVPSYNIELPDDTGFMVLLRMGRKKGDFWTPFYYLGKWGRVLEKGVKKVIKDAHGRIDTDYFSSDEVFDRLEYRIILFTADPDKTPIVRRFAVACSNTRNDATLAARHRKLISAGPKSGWTRRLSVPYRSQRDEDPKIAGSVCSPTSVSMVMEYRGVKQPTATMAQMIWDDEYQLFGNWPRAVQGAFMFGVPGYLERFGEWTTVKRRIADGQPVIASIRVDEQDGLRGAPYRKTNGHLLVIVGFDADGNIEVNDPAAKTARQGMIAYSREEMEKAWFGHGGVGYVLTAPDGRVGSRALSKQ